MIINASAADLDDKEDEKSITNKPTPSKQLNQKKVQSKNKTKAVVISKKPAPKRKK